MCYPSTKVADLFASENTFKQAWIVGTASPGLMAINLFFDMVEY